jgi:hypothetical protein
MSDDFNIGFGKDVKRDDVHSDYDDSEINICKVITELNTEMTLE